MHEYLKFFGTNNQQETVRFLIYERGLIRLNKKIGSLLFKIEPVFYIQDGVT